MEAVTLRHVSKFYDRSKAVDDVSLQIQKGEFLTLLGPSGCGKTTTLRLISGLVIPDQGAILLGGTDVTNLPVHRRNIGMAFQSHALFPHMTVGENIGFGLKMRGVGRAERDQKAREALELVRLSDFADRIPSQLSGGQQQRIALARALVFRPHVLLLDEPFGALDRKLREIMQTELRDLTRKIGMTSIFVTHDQEEALILSDRIAVMNRGKIEQIGVPGDIFERPATPFVADFMGFGNVLAGSVSSLNDKSAIVMVDRVPVEVDYPTDLALRQSASIAIRAEHIKLHPTGRHDSPTHQGTVSSASYQGVVCAYRIKLDGFGDQDLVVREPTQSPGRARFASGERVSVSWPTESVRVLADRNSE